MSKINDDGFLELSGVNNKVFQEVLNAEKFPILAGVSPLSLRVLNQDAHMLHVSRGVEMMRAGDAPHDLYFINKGSVSIGKRIDGNMKIVGKLIAGTFYGEYGALRGKTRFVSVYTAEPSEIIRVKLGALQQLFDVDEKFKSRVYTLMQDRLLKSFLFSHIVFKSLTSVARDAIAEELKVVELERDEVLFREGDLVEHYYLLMSGEAEITIKIENVLTVVEIRREDGVLGEVRTNEGKRYAYGVYAANNLDLLVLDRQSLSRIKKIDLGAFNLLKQLINNSATKTALVINKILGKNT